MGRVKRATGPKANRKYVPSRVQVETWDDGEAVRFLAVAQNATEAVAWLAVHDKATNVMSTGVSQVERCPSHHDRDALARAVPLAPATVLDLIDLEMLGTKVSPLPEAIEECFNEARGPRVIPWRDKTFSNPEGVFHVRLRMLGFPGGRHHARGLGWFRHSTTRLFGHPPEGTIAAPGIGEPPSAGMITFVNKDVGKEVRRLFTKGVAAFAANHCWQATALLDIHSWNPETYAYFAEPGERGDRRRQAAAVYPGLAPAIACLPDVARAVDAGKPFEASLREGIVRLAPHGAGDGLTVAGLRKLRALPAKASYQDVMHGIGLAAKLPLDWLPREAAGWAQFAKDTADVMIQARRLGLDIAELLAGHGLEGRGVGKGREPGPADVTVLRGGADMAAHFDRTMVSPVLGFLGVATVRNDEYAPSEAGRILFSGKTVAGIDALQKGWHRDMDTLSAALPLRKGATGWPALFRPYVTGTGFVLSCLTTEAALKAEGGRSADADGIQGLRHCVGSYAERAFAGAVHIASVRRGVGPRAARVSTVELEAEGNGGGRLRLTVMQHAGRENDDPPKDAEAAVRELVRALETGTHPHAPEALERRDVAAFSAGYDWREPGMLAQAFAAWRRHLPRGIARGGVEALVRRIAEGRGVPVDGESLTALTASVDVDPRRLPEPGRPFAGEPMPAGMA